jgi:hypothetical protein
MHLEVSAAMSGGAFGLLFEVNIISGLTHPKQGRVGRKCMCLQHWLVTWFAK